MELLSSLRLQLYVVPSGYAEPPHPELTPRELAILHARHKCEAVASSTNARPVVAADTVVDLDGRAYNKPRDAQDARRMLRDLSGRTHRVHTAFAIALGDRSELVRDCVTTAVTFYDLDDALIAAYVDTGEPLDKAGAYGIQGYGATLVERVEGDFYTVMGFPLAHFAKTLRALGFSLPMENQTTSERT